MEERFYLSMMIKTIYSDLKYLEQPVCFNLEVAEQFFLPITNI